jgi:hypothetical protein
MASLAVMLRRALRHDEASASASFTDGAVPVAAADKERSP